MRIAIIVFPGSNCDHDTYYVFKKLLNISVDFVWHMESDLKKYDCIILPGGFSYGDYLRTGAIARFSPIMSEIIKAAKAGKLIMGICNGFQILVESGLLPGALIINEKIKFLSKNVVLEVDSIDSAYTCSFKKGQRLIMPIAHKQGNYLADEKTLTFLEENNLIVFRYAADNNNGNPNGSIANIAGIINKDRNVLGMMPHPERAAELLLGSDDGMKIFKSMIDAS